MEIIILQDSQELAKFAAARFQHQLTKKPDSVFGLATGRSPLDLYKLLAEKVKAGLITFSKASSFNLDEFYGLDTDDPRSYRSFMQRELFDHVDFQTGNTYLPECGPDEDPAIAADRFEQRIREAGGIDFQLLGLGQNGHIGFNEPTSSFASRTRLKTLTPETLLANRGASHESAAQPELAITMGVATIMDAREILLLASGGKKARAVQQLVEGCISARWPATILQMHAQLTVAVDEPAASRLELRDYYLQVQRQRRLIGSYVGNDIACQEAVR